MSGDILITIQRIQDDVYLLPEGDWSGDINDIKRQLQTLSDNDWVKLSDGQFLIYDPEE